MDASDWCHPTRDMGVYPHDVILGSRSYAQLGRVSQAGRRIDD